MSLLRDSAIVGAATFLVGSAFMQISLTEDGKAVGWWPYVGTFLSGALGFYLLGATNVVKVKNAESFSADYRSHHAYICKACDKLHKDTRSAKNCCPNPDFVCKVCNKNHGNKRFARSDADQCCCKHDMGHEIEADDEHFWAICSECRFQSPQNPMPKPKWEAESFSAESPTDDELEMWSYREEDGSMLVSIDEDGELHTELTYKDGDLINLKRFMAEVFEADRKARRRTTLTWARGIEPSFIDRDNTPNDSDESVSPSMFKQPRPYEVGNYWDSNYTNSNAYHISGLPSGYHIHLWKPQRRGNYWRVYMKSPNSSRWVGETSGSKRYMMNNVLEWYNDDIAVPEEAELSPIQQLMIGQGMISGEIQIHRVVPTPGKIQYYFSGGSEALAPTLFATYEGQLEFNTNDIPSTLLHFCRGLIYIGVETTGNVRSVNRYNKDRKQWVSSHPAWFQNMCKQGIKKLHFAQDWDGTYEINGVEFLRFYGSRSLPEKKYVDLGNDIEKPMFQVRLPIEDGEEVVDDGWITPRPSTQRKMYKIKGKSGAEKLGFESEVGILNKCVAKYQPQTFDEMQNNMLEGNVTHNASGWGLDGSAPAGHIMCRRFKKK